ncbi:MAG TPA: hypothetical protein VK982_02470 [Bacteroidales bacterium]|nr:hypothetical protein [Bacteroidales bacterium]
MIPTQYNTKDHIAEITSLLKDAGYNTNEINIILTHESFEDERMRNVALIETVERIERKF